MSTEQCKGTFPNKLPYFICKIFILIENFCDCTPNVLFFEKWSENVNHEWKKFQSHPTLVSFNQGQMQKRGAVISLPKLDF